MALGLENVASLLQPMISAGVDRKLVQVIDEVGKTITGIWLFHDKLNTLSKEGAEGVIRSVIINLLTAGLADIGIPLDKVMGAQGLVLRGIFDEVAYWTGLAQKGVQDPNYTPDDPSKGVFRNQLEKYLQFFVGGKVVANGPRPCRNALRCADPVVLHRGEFERSLTDLVVNGAGIDFIFRRTYRSGVAYLGALGPNWDHSYNLRLRQENEFVLGRLTGQLSEQRFIQHPRFGAAEFNYYVPPDGVHDVIVSDGAESFLLKRPQGVTYHYEATDQPNEHRVRRIEDRFGNYLDFVYSPEDHLQQVFVNSRHRHVTFQYDELGRIARLEDHTGRVVRYAFDDLGYLDCAEGPALPGKKTDRRERYEYDQVGEVYKLARVWDWKERVVVENEYEQDPLSDFFGYVIRQKENRGETTFFYETITEEVDPAIPARDVPTLRVWETRRNGHQVEHFLNEFGNELLVREQFVEGSRIREAISRFRYNADGQILAKIDPEGIITQYLFGRDHVAEAIDWPDLDPVLGDVPMKDRMGFGNLLAAVTRGRRLMPGSAIFDIGFWEQHAPSVKMPDLLDPSNPDIVTKYRYDRDSQLLLSRSDPRHTISADPLHVESSRPGDPNFNRGDHRYVEHQRHLTRFEYGQAPQFELLRTIFPDRTRPSALDGVVSVGGIEDVFRRYDANGRPLERVDVRGYEWFYEYYPLAERAKKGFLQRQLVPHQELILDKDTPDILEIQKVGRWRAFDSYLQSSGTVGDRLRISVEGVRVALHQSTNLAEIVSQNTQVDVRIDDVQLPPWDQTTDDDYVAADLGRGVHVVEIEDTVGISFNVGRVRTHVSLEFEVDDLGRVLRETDAVGNVTVNVLDVLGRKEKTTRGPAANPTVVHYQYDPGDRLIFERTEWRDETGQNRPEISMAKRYDYDQTGLLLIASIGPEQNGEKRIIRHRYDSEDNPWETTNPRGVRTYFDHDALNRQIRTIRGACSCDMSITTTTYDLADRVLAQRDPRDALYYNGYRDAQGTWQSGIDSRGRIRAKTDPLGHMIVTDFDALDKPIVVRQFQRRTDGRFVMLSRRVTEYDEHGDLFRLTEAIFERPILTANPVHAPDHEFQASANAGDTQSAATEFHLDAAGNVNATRNPDGGIQRQRFDGQGRRFDEVDAEGGRTFRIYDGNGNVFRIYAFDPVRDQATGNILHYEVFLQLHEYDELNREIARVDSYGNRWQQQYDTLGNLTCTIDPLGNVIRFQHNAFGEEVILTQERTQTGLGGAPQLPPLITERKYDANGNIEVVIDPAQRRTEFVYDALDRLIKSRFAIGPNEPFERRTYDPVGNPVSITERNGLVKKMQYDLLNRHSQTDIDPSGVTQQNALSPLSARFASFKYDAAGRLIHHENNYCIVEAHRDSRGLAISEKVTIRNIAGAPNQLEIVRGFDLAGRRKALIYPSGRELLYTFDHLGRVKLVRNVASPQDYPGRPANAAGVDLARYSYVGGRLTQIELGNGLNMILRFDGRGHVFERVITQPNGAVIWRIQGLRDAAGHTRLESALTRNGARSRRFSLDSIYRLTHYNDDPVNWLNPLTLSPPQAPIDPVARNDQASINAAIAPLAVPANLPVFEYDAVGNRLNTREHGFPSFASIPNTLNQYGVVDGTPWRYDANGNLRSDGIRSFAYDLENALQEISDIATGAKQATYYRDAFGRVVAEATPQGTTFLVSDDSTPLVEINANERIEHTPDHLGEGTIHSARDGEDYWIARDGLGSLRLLSDYQINIIAMPLYRPFGIPEDGELALSPLRFGFGSMWYTLNLPFLHSKMRSYRNDLGRYLQRDLIGPFDGRNLYSYVDNRPVDSWDPTGLQAEEVADVTVIGASQHVWSEEDFEPLHVTATRPNVPPSQATFAPAMPAPVMNSTVGSARTDYSLQRIIGWVKSEDIPKGLPRMLGATVSTPEHQEKVSFTVNWAIQKAESLIGMKVSVSDVLSLARSVVTDLREDRKLPRSSESIVLRDAERFLWGRAGITVFNRNLGIPEFVLNLYALQSHAIYNSLKAIVGWTGIMRANQELEMSAVGGGEWFRWGLEHYREYDFQMLDEKTSPRLLIKPPSTTLYRNYTTPYLLPNERP